MTRKWINGAIAVVFLLSLVLGACSREEVRTVTPAPTVAPAAKATGAPTVAPTAKPTPKPTVAPVAKASPSPAPPAATAAPKPAPSPTAKPLSKPAPPPKAQTVTVLADNLGFEGFLPSSDTQIGFSLLPNYEALWNLDPDTRELLPMLAETMPQWSEDQKTLFINLRQGVQFQDGWGEMTAEDVKFTIEMAGRDGSINPSKTVMAQAKVEILGPYKLAVHIPAPDWGWVFNAATPARYQLPIVSKKYIEKVGEKEASNMPIGTGPFKMVKHEFGKSIEFEAVPNHWRVTPDYKTLVIKVIKEPATVIAMLRTGEADVGAIPAPFVPEARAGGIEIRTIRNVGTIGIALGGQYLPSRDTFDPNVPWVLAKEPDRALKVRKALNLAVNRQEIIDKVLNGIGGPWPIIASPVNVEASYDPSWKPYPYDPVEAKRLLTEAGYPNGFEVTMVQFASTGHSTEEIAEAVSIYWEKIGIKVKRQPIDLTAQRSRQLARRNAGVAFPAWRNTWDDEMIGVTSFYWSKSTALGLQFEYSAIDALIDKGLAEADFAKRQKINYDFHKLIYDNYYSVPVSLEHMPVGVGKRIGEWRMLTGNPFLYGFENIKLK
ncbi:MAG: hypothetical protein HY673_26600 [Chloroflexi bacterium]|nr:hypothetical protein [Chloroflexota bacterium]